MYGAEHVNDDDEDQFDAVYHVRMDHFSAVTSLGSFLGTMSSEK